MPEIKFRVGRVDCPNRSSPPNRKEFFFPGPHNHNAPKLGAEFGLNMQEHTAILGETIVSALRLFLIIGSAKPSFKCSKAEIASNKHSSGHGDNSTTTSHFEWNSETHKVFLLVYFFIECRICLL